MGSFYKLLHLTLIYFFVIENNIKYLINKLWYLPLNLAVFFGGRGCSFKIAAPGPPELNFVASGMIRLKTAEFIDQRIIFFKSQSLKIVKNKSL